MTISVRLDKGVEKMLRADSINEKKNISEIVNRALAKHYFQYKYFDSINAHHLDPVVVKAFFQLVDTPEKIEDIADAGAIMLKKFISYQNNQEGSITGQIEMIKKFLEIHSIQVSIKNLGSKTTMVGIHEFGIVFSQILSKGVIKTLQPHTRSIESEDDESGFTLTMFKKN
ncbi:hypothetical protein OAN18_05900 [Nitrosopumilus sp.]|nr:hypothetical protein [Nitrosopumilus sp.]